MDPVKRLKAVPSVEAVLKSAEEEGLLREIPRPLAARAVRQALEAERERLSEPEPDIPDEPVRLRNEILARALEEVRRAVLRNLTPVINATGVVVHTNLGRAPISRRALDALSEIAAGYSTLEYDLVAGERGSRHDLVREALIELTGAGDALVVNNNAAAVLLAVNTLAFGRELVVSRGELIEIGGSFRLPDVVARGGARLVEVGTTNRTRVEDYEAAVRQQTGCLMKAHWSNYTINGFVETVPTKALVALGERTGVPVLHDLGSGLLLRGEELGLGAQTSVRESVESGAGVITMSGDKLLGGPQAGIVVGRRDLVARMRKNPLVRALRPGKLTLAVLAATLDSYLDGRPTEHIPVPMMLTASIETLDERSRALAERLDRELGAGTARAIVVESRAGGGAAPGQPIESRGVAITTRSRPNDLAARLRFGDVPVIAVVRDDEVVFNLRTVAPEQDDALFRAIIKAVREP